MQAVQVESVNRFFQFFTEVGNPIIWVGVASYFYWKGREKESFYLMNVILLVSIMTGLLKGLVARERPSTGESGALSGFFPSSSSPQQSFPSGHASTMSAMITYFYRQVKKPWHFLLIALIILGGLSRLYLGAHYFSDVIAGIMLGLALGELGYWFKRKTEHMHFKLTRIKEEALLFAVITAFLIVFFYLKEFVLFSFFIGYYAGFVLLKECNVKQEKQGLGKLAAGFAGLILLTLTGLMIDGLLLETAFFLLAGAWVSFILPTVWERI